MTRRGGIAAEITLAGEMASVAHCGGDDAEANGRAYRVKYNNN